MSNRSHARRSIVTATLAIGLMLAGSTRAFGQSAEQPQPADNTESVEVNLTIIDTVALDRRGKPVRDLTVDDFELIVDGKFVPVDTFDAHCGFRSGEEDVPFVATAGAVQGPPKIVLALDYLHLSPIEWVVAIDRMKDMVLREGIDGFRMMLVALTGAVRVEQSLTDDSEAVLASLDRMQNDPTLAVPDFYHQNSFVFLRGLTALFDLLGSKPGNKAVVLFSAMKDVPLDAQFERIAATAAASRCSIYPVDVRGLMTVEPIRRTREEVHREAREKLGILGIGDSEAVDISVVDAESNMAVAWAVAPLIEAACG